MYSKKFCEFPFLYIFFHAFQVVDGVVDYARSYVYAGQRRGEPETITISNTTMCSIIIYICTLYFVTVLAQTFFRAHFTRNTRAYNLYIIYVCPRNLLCFFFLYERLRGYPVFTESQRFRRAVARESKVICASRALTRATVTT